MNRNNIVTVLLAAALLVGVGPAVAQSQAPGTTAVRPAKYNLLGESVGLVSFDPVSYFPEGGERPQRGLLKFSLEFEGVTYRFTSQGNLDRFKANPAKYVPAYGGWCAWALGELGKRVDVDPESYLIRNGRVLVFYRDKELDTRALWLKNEAVLSRKAEANWASLNK